MLSCECRMGITIFCFLIGYSMRHVAAYLLAALGGNDNPSAKDIKAILSSVGVEADDASLKTVVDSLKGKVRTLLENYVAQLHRLLAEMWRDYRNDVNAWR